MKAKPAPVPIPKELDVLEFTELWAKWKKKHPMEPDGQRWMLNMLKNAGLKQALDAARSKIETGYASLTIQNPPTFTTHERL